MAEAASYLTALARLGFIVRATAPIRHELAPLACMARR
jgi:hypothetical protein